MKKSKTDMREKQGGTLFGSARVDDTEEKLQKLFDGLLQKSDDGEFTTYTYHRYIVGSCFRLGNGPKVRFRNCSRTQLSHPWLTPRRTF